MTVIIKEGEVLTKINCIACSIRPVDQDEITLQRLFITDNDLGEVLCPDYIFDGSPYGPEVYFESEDWQDSMSLTQFKETW